MNGTEIIQKLKDLGYDAGALGYEDMDDDQLKESGIGEIKLIQKKGGSGQGEEYWKVFFLPEHDVYLRVDGFYSSQAGVDFGDSEIEEVRPVEKTITVYE